MKASKLALELFNYMNENPSKDRKNDIEYHLLRREYLRALEVEKSNVS